MASLGIDFGAHIARLAICREAGKSEYIGGMPLDPPVSNNLFTRPIDSRPIVLRLDEPSQLISPRDAQVTDKQAVSILQIIKKKAETKANSTLNDCVITVPCSYGSRGRQRLLNAAHAAGFELVNLVSEPLAVLLEKKRDDTEKMVLSLAWGEGGCNVLLAKQIGPTLNEVVSRGETAIGWSALTDQIFTHVRKTQEQLTHQLPSSNPQIIAQQQAQVKRAMEELCTKNETEIDLISAGEAVRSFRLTRQALLNWIGLDLDKGIEMCQQILQKAHVESPKMITEFWLVGEAAGMPYIKEKLTRWWGREPSIAEPASAALGAAIYAQVCASIQKKVPVAPDVPSALPDPGILPVPKQSLNTRTATDKLEGTTAVQPSAQLPTPNPEILFQDANESKMSRLIELLALTDQYLEADDTQAASQAVLEALDMVNSYRARVFYAQGMRYFREAEKLMELIQVKDIKNKALRKDFNELLTKASDYFGNALQLDHIREEYHSALKDIEKKKNDLIIIDFYNNALEAMNQNKHNEALSNFGKILKIDPQNTIVPPLFLVEFRKYYSGKIQLLNQKMKKNPLNIRDIETDAKYMKSSLDNAISLIGKDPELMRDLSDIDVLLKTLRI